MASAELWLMFRLLDMAQAARLRVLKHANTDSASAYAFTYLIPTTYLVRQKGFEPLTSRL